MGNRTPLAFWPTCAHKLTHVGPHGSLFTAGRHIYWSCDYAKSSEPNMSTTKEAPADMLRSSPMAPPQPPLASTTTAAASDPNRHSLSYPPPPAMSSGSGLGLGPVSGTETEDAEETHSDADSRPTSTTSAAGANASGAAAEKKPKKVRKRTYYMRKVLFAGWYFACCAF